MTSDAITRERFERLCERLQTLERPSTLTTRFDGARIAVTLSQACTEAGEHVDSRIWSVDHAGRATCLTHGPGADLLPAFAPNDARLAFASDRAEPGRLAVYVLDTQPFEDIGGEPDTAASTGPDGPYVAPDGAVESLVWSPDGHSLLCTVVEAGLDQAPTAGAAPMVWEAPGDPQVSGAQPPRRTLHRLLLRTGRFESLLPPPWSAWEVCDAGGGNVVVIASRDGSERGWYRPELLLRRASGELQTLYRPDWQLQCPVVSPDGRRLAVIEGWASDRGLVAGSVLVIDLVDGAVNELCEEGVLENVCTIGWRDDERLHFTAWDGHGTRFGVVGVDGQVVGSCTDAATLGPNRFTAQVLPVGGDDAVVAVRECSGHPASVVIRTDRASPWRTLWSGAGTGAETHEAWPATTLREIDWRADDGLAIGGLLWMPDRPEASSPPPAMVVAVHGGPSSAARFTFDPCGVFDLVVAGYAVLLPNYRGSAGRGTTFSRANIGDPAGAEFDDILAGVTHCVAEGLADPARLGITGVSYGGYLSAWAAAVSDRFAAAVVTSGITDLASCHFDSNQSFCELIVGGDPQGREARERMMERSPRYRIGLGHSPTLFLHGQEDRCTPVSQAESQHRALVGVGIESELVVYPREGHTLHERAHQLDARRRRRDWFDAHLRTPRAADGAAAVNRGS